MAALEGVWVVVTITVISKIIFSVNAAVLSCSFHEQFTSRYECSSSDNQDYVLKSGDLSVSDQPLELVLRGCYITDVEDGSFNNFGSLELIALSENKIRSLKLGLFDEARQLRSLYLNTNELTDIQLGLLDQNTELHTLDLSRNNIITSSLNSGVLDKLTKLKHLDLSRNAIVGRTLDHPIFANSKQMVSINFSGNDMSASPEDLLSAFHGLNELYLSECHLTEVPKFAKAANLKTLTELYLYSNRISNIDDPTTFINLVNLSYLDLSRNAITSINENIFRVLRRLEVLSLNNNLLESLPENLFHNFVNASILDFSHNLIEHVPDNAFRGIPLKSLNLAYNKFTYLPDNFLLSLGKAPAQLETFLFNRNPWQCACLMQVLHDVKSMGIDYEYSYVMEYTDILFDGKRPVCVTAGEFNCKRRMEFNQFFVELFYDVIKRK